MTNGSQAGYRVSEVLFGQNTTAVGRTDRATGDPTIHGQTNSVTVPLTAQRTTDGFRTSGSIPVTFADYGVDAPNVGGITVEDEGNIEFLLVFAPA